MRVESSDPDATERSAGTGSSRRFALWLLAATTLGLVVRLIFIFRYKWDQGIGGDAAYYHYQANALAKGLGFVDPWSWALRKTGVYPGAEHPPLYTIFLSIPSALGFDTFRQHILAGGILGSLTCTMVGLAGRAVAGARVGIIAAFLAAIYANLWVSDALVLSETIAAISVAGVVWLAYRFWRDPSVRNAAFFGLACGLVALSRAEIVFYLPIVALPLALRAAGLDTKQRLIRLGAMALLTAVPVMPWVAYNLSRFHDPVTLSTGGDFTLANTYCETTFYGERVGWWDLTCMADRWKRPGDESQVAAKFRQDGLDYLDAHLGRLPVVLAARVGRMWELYRPIQKLSWDSFEQGRNPNEVTWLALGQFYVLAVLAIAGLVMLRRRKTIIYPLIGLAISSTLAAMIAFGNTRYRVPAEITLVIGAAVALSRLYDRWRPSRQGDAPLPAVDSDDSGGQTSLVSSRVVASKDVESV